MLDLWRMKKKSSHMEEAHIYNALNNLANSVTSGAINLTNLTMTNSKLEERLRWNYPKKSAHRPTEKILCGATETQSEN